MIRLNRKGFTLVELLVVITIIVITGVIALPRLGEFRDNQDLESGAEKILSAIKQTQSNATSGSSCGDQFNPTRKAVDWRIRFLATSVVVEPNCGCDAALNIPRTTETLTSGVSIVRVNFDNGVRGAAVVDLTGAPNGQVGSLTSFSNIAGAINFKDYQSLDVLNYKRMIVVLQSSGRPELVGVFVEKGGLLYTGAVR